MIAMMHAINTDRLATNNLSTVLMREVRETKTITPLKGLTITNIEVKAYMKNVIFEIIT
jgi:hypothetical protein